MELHGLDVKRDPLQAVGESRVEIIPLGTSMTSDLGYAVIQCQGELDGTGREDGCDKRRVARSMSISNASTSVPTASRFSSFPRYLPPESTFVDLLRFFRKRPGAYTRLPAHCSAEAPRCRCSVGDMFDGRIMSMAQAPHDPGS